MVVRAGARKVERESGLPRPGSDPRSNFSAPAELKPESIIDRFQLNLPDAGAMEMTKTA